MNPIPQKGVVFRDKSENEGRLRESECGYGQNSRHLDCLLLGKFPLLAGDAADEVFAAEIEIVVRTVGL